MKINTENFEKAGNSKFSEKNFDAISFGNRNKSKFSIGDIILIILFIISIITGLWYLFGDSPTFEQSMIIFLMSTVFGMAINMGRSELRLKYIEKDLGNLKMNVKEGFDRIKEDMNLIKKKLKI